MHDFGLSESHRIKKFLTQSPSTSGLDIQSNFVIPALAMPMHMGLDGSGFIISDKQSDNSWFLKAYFADMWGQFDFAKTRKSCEVAGQLGIGPRQLDANEELGLMLFENLNESRTAQVGDLDDPVILNKLLDLMRRWHAEGEAASDQSPLDRMRVWQNKLETPLADGREIPKSENYVAIVAWVDRICGKLELAGWGNAPLHGDNSLSNFLIAENGQLHMVDYERGLVGDVMYDVAGICNEYCRMYDDVEILVEAYCGYAETQTLARCRANMLVDDFFWGCWGKSMHFLSSRSTEVEFFKYGEYRFHRCLYRIDNWDLDSIFRAI